MKVDLQILDVPNVRVPDDLSIATPDVVGKDYVTVVTLLDCSRRALDACAVAPLDIPVSAASRDRGIFPTSLKIANASPAMRARLGADIARSHDLRHPCSTAAVSVSRLRPSPA